MSDTKLHRKNINIYKSSNSKLNKTETAVFGSTKLKVKNILHTVNR